MLNAKMKAVDDETSVRLIHRKCEAGRRLPIAYNCFIKVTQINFGKINLGKFDGNASVSKSERRVEFESKADCFSHTCLSRNRATLKPMHSKQIQMHAPSGFLLIAH